MKHNIPGVPADAVAKKIEETNAIAEANATPFPGASAEAFAPCLDIPVQGYKVRAFYDADFEILQAAEHPICKMTLDGVQFGEKLGDFRGANAWLLCYVFTHTGDEIDKLAAKGVQAVKDAAKAEFGRKPLGLIVALNIAVMKQFSAYLSTIVGFDEAGEDGQVKKEQPS